jgi:hypothetical protein
LKTLGDIINGKTAYDQVLTNNLQERLTDNSKENILNLTADKRFKVNVPHTAILMDDAVNAFKRKEHAALEDMLFRNRQPRFTIFICVQDQYSIPVKIRRNLDSLWLFGGFTDSNMFQILLNSFSPSEEDKEKAWEQYRELYVHDAIQFNLRPTGVEIVFLYSDYVGPGEEKRKKRETEEDNELECFKSNIFQNF